jgi:hypothetical protein
MPLKVKPLPPLPRSFPAGSFHDAVGNFQFNAETPAVRFQKDEPTTLRFMLQGEGNFPEINEIPVDFPPFVEVVSRRALGMGSGQYANKSFEISIVPHTDKDFELPPVVFTYFDPRQAKYQSRSLNPIHFSFETKPNADPVFDHPDVILDPPEAAWHSAGTLHRLPGFWVLQMLLAAAMLGAILRELSGRTRSRELITPRALRRRRWELAQAEWQAGRRESFLRIADELAYEILREKAGGPAAPPTRSAALAKVQDRLPAPVLEGARRLFNARERSYSGGSQADSAGEDLLSALGHLIDVAA